MSAKKKICQIPFFVTIGLAIVTLEIINLILDAVMVAKIDSDRTPLQINFGKVPAIAHNDIYSLNVDTNNMIKYISRGLRYEKDEDLRKIGDEILSMLSANRYSENEKNVTSNVLDQTSLIIDKPLNDEEMLMSNALSMNLKIYTAFKPKRSFQNVEFIEMSSNLHYKTILLNLIEKVKTDYVIGLNAV